MPKETIIAGLDVGSCFIRTVVAKMRANQTSPQIIGMGQVPSFGLRRGVVVDIEEAVKNISQSVQEAERNSGLSIERAYVSLSGNHITSRTSKGVVAVSRADGEISREDVEEPSTLLRLFLFHQIEKFFILFRAVSRLMTKGVSKTRPG